MNRITIVVLIASVFLFSCAAQAPFTQQETAFAQKANNYPTTFSLPNDKAEEAWARAQLFIAQYSNMKIQIATQYVLQTYNPVGAVPIYGYNITRTPAQNETRFTVQCMHSNMWSGKEAQQNASMLSYYMATGELELRFVYR